ncbi:type II toxin-antitoxin system BrnA family antitoxin [Salinisphaera aquimarina]|uniref:Type II toxin-antitoxin system BrnA family antitoxin n=1 Tax=Salinisphaera aquimarina TaxID=2094031 RepID=A0ABV7EPZ2_9GAMM
MKAESFDEKIEAGKDVTADLDLSKAHRPNQASRRVNVDFPGWMVEELDREARRLGVTRQSIIKVWLSERLEQVGANKRT